MLDYNKIPDGASKEEVDMYLYDFIKNKDVMVEKYGIKYTLEKLARITEEYCSYKLDDDNCNILSSFLIENIAFNDAELMDLVSFITVNMTLIKVLDYMVKNKNNKSIEVIKIITETEKEIDSKIEKEKLCLEILSKMKKNKLRGTYRSIYDYIVWQIEESIQIIILPGASGNECDDVIKFYYKAPDGNVYMYDKSDSIPHCDIMNLLCEYNNYSFVIKKEGLFIKKYKLYIVKKGLEVL